jgi:hypothetical protein
MDRKLIKRKREKSVTDHVWHDLERHPLHMARKPQKKKGNDHGQIYCYERT